MKSLRKAFHRSSDKSSTDKGLSEGDNQGRDGNSSRDERESNLLRDMVKGGGEKGKPEQGSRRGSTEAHQEHPGEDNRKMIEDGRKTRSRKKEMMDEVMERRGRAGGSSQWGDPRQSFVRLPGIERHRPSASDRQQSSTLDTLEEE